MHVWGGGMSGWLNSEVIKFESFFVPWFSQKSHDIWKTGLGTVEAKISRYFEILLLSTFWAQSYQMRYLPPRDIFCSSLFHPKIKNHPVGLSIHNLISWKWWDTHYPTKCWRPPRQPHSARSSGSKRPPSSPRNSSATLLCRSRPAGRPRT